MDLVASCVRVPFRAGQISTRMTSPQAKKGRAAAAQAGRDARAELLRAMPPVDECLRACEGVAGIDGLGREYVKLMVRRAQAELRLAVLFAGAGGRVRLRRRASRWSKR